MKIMGATSRKGQKIKKQIPINLKLVFPAKVKNLKKHTGDKQCEIWSFKQSKNFSNLRKTRNVFLNFIY